MNIEKAIEQLERGTRESRSTNNQMLREAMNLGIEALKSVKQDRVLRLPGRLEPLPGETEE